MERKRVALITGAGRGIGRGIALELARIGFKIAGCDILYEPKNAKSGLFEVWGEASKLGAAFLPIKGDVSNLAEHDRILAAVQAEYGRLDVLVHNAGVAPEVRTDVLQTTPGSFDRVLGVNVRGPFFLTQKAVPRLLETAARDAGGVKPAIVFITSVSAVASSTARAEYCLSKAALSMAARVFADRLAESDIGVYEVRPGIIQTDMTAPVREKYDALIAAGLVPQKRWGHPEDVGKAVAALVRGDFPYSTGLILEVSGGMDIRRL
ncbi:MAG: 3-ketoacyl-ACP reductase [Candidatus Aminicenantales bacterium]|jgi:NAD(P)-dependent dehydrogenase (short-subunit alcohol dehydrogenase family)